jgi:hypothetical protein
MAAEQNRTQQIALLMKMLQDGLITESEFKDLITKIGDQPAPAPAPAPAPNTTVPNVPAENSDNPEGSSLPAPEVPTSSVLQNLDKQKTTKIVLAVVALVIIALFAINKVQSSNRAETRKKAVDQQNQQNSADKERQKVIACGEETDQINAWNTYLAVSNAHDDYEGISLKTAGEWAREESAAIGQFIFQTKSIQTNDVQTEKNVLIGVLKDLQDVITLQINATSFSELNDLINKSNLAGNLLNDAKDDVFNALYDACQATS